MTIRRGARRNGFTVLDNAVFNAGLSFRAIGLLTYLLSKPDHWEVSVQQLVNISSGTLRPDGRDSIYSIIDELMQKGFIRRERKRDNGRMNGYDYEVHDVPQREFPSPKTPLPETAAPETPLPSTAEPTQVKTDLEVTTEQAVTTELPTAAQPADRDMVVPDELVTSAGGKFMSVEIAGKAFKVPSDIGYPKAGSRIHAAWAAYAVCYHAVYKNWPTYNPVDAGIISNILKVVPADEFPAVVGAFIRSKEQYVVSRGHNLKLLMADAQKYLTQARTGKSMTVARARQMDRQDANRSVVDDAMSMLFPGAASSPAQEAQGDVIDA